jgi:hypothetical protein
MCSADGLAGMLVPSGLAPPPTYTRTTGEPPVVVSTLTAMPLKTGSPSAPIWHLVKRGRLTRKMRPAVSTM